MSENRTPCNGRAEGDALASPVDRVIEVFGWPRTCDIAQVTPSAVQKWKRKLSSKGGGGLVPSRLQHRYLTLSEQEGLGLTARDLIGEPRV